MKRALTITFILLFCSAKLLAQSANYDVALLPESLKKNAHSVKREQKIEFEVKAIDKAYYTVHEVITVLDEGGKDELQFVP